jgi:hypothetical protein
MVIVRGRSEESVLTGCKTPVGGQGIGSNSTDGACQYYTAGISCFDCSAAVPS